MQLVSVSQYVRYRKSLGDNSRSRDSVYRRLNKGTIVTVEERLGKKYFDQDQADRDWNKGVSQAKIRRTSRLDECLPRPLQEKLSEEKNGNAADYDGKDESERRNEFFRAEDEALKYANLVKNSCPQLIIVKNKLIALELLKKYLPELAGQTCEELALLDDEDDCQEVIKKVSNEILTKLSGLVGRYKGKPYVYKKISRELDSYPEYDTSADKFAYYKSLIRKTDHFLKSGVYVNRAKEDRFATRSAISLKNSFGNVYLKVSGLVCDAFDSDECGEIILKYVVQAIKAFEEEVGQAEDPGDFRPEVDEHRGAWICAFLKMLKPRVVPSLQEFAKTLYLPSSVTANPGPHSIALEDCPYFDDMLTKAHPDSGIEFIGCQKSGQIGWTAFLRLLMLHGIVEAPRATGFVRENKTPLLSFFQTKIDPVIKANQHINCKMGETPDGKSANQVLTKTFDGGYIQGLSASSNADTKETQTNLFLGDEVDEWPRNVGGQGSAYELFKVRQRTYKGRRLAVIGGTPTFKGRSNIEDLCGNEAQVRYKWHVPCTNEGCYQFQEIEFKNIKYNDKGNPAEVYGLRCIHCKSLFMTSDKDRLDTMKLGKWVPDKDVPEKKLKRIAYYLSAFMAPYYMFSWSEATEMYEKCLRSKDDAGMIVFDNTVRGVTVDYEGSGEDWENVYAKRQPYKYGNYTAPSEDILYITCGVDVQGDRLEAGIIGWTDKLESYLLAYEVFRENGQNTSDYKSGTWKLLSEMLQKTITHPSGYEMPIDIAFIDSSDQTTTVYKFCLGYSVHKVVPIKGRHQLRTPVSDLRPCYITEKFSNKKKRLKTKGYFLNVGVSLLKTELYQQLKLDPPDEEDEKQIFPSNFHHFPENLSEERFRQLCAEEAIITKVNGVNQIKYEPTRHKDNEFLDVKIYNRAALSYKGVDLWTQSQWNRRRKRIYDEAARMGMIKQALKPEPADPKPVRKRQELKKQVIPARNPDDIARQKMHEEKDTIDIEKIKTKFSELAKSRDKMLAERKMKRNSRNRRS